MHCFLFRAQAVVQRGRAAGFTGTIAGTRKTTPGFRLVEKYALAVGGCSPHRHDLSSMVMIKDSHVDAARRPISDLVREAKALAGPTLKVEVECRSLAEAVEAATAGADIVMLDNAGAGQAASWAATLKTGFPGLLVEASGGITEASVQEFAASPHLDILSMGCLTQDMVHVDYSLVVQRPDPSVAVIAG